MKLFNLSRMARRALFRMAPRTTASALGVAALVAASSAFAHAHLVSSEPAANAAVAAPAELTMHFTEPLEPAFSRIELADASGKPALPADAPSASVDKGDAKVMHLPLPPLGAGRYAVHWTAVATDGHRTQGDFSFNVK
ncbi:copper homeostasis periplasmic binding protein CopC [Paraburkholderia sp. D15]|uniref:copper homeostasis periplasmic binding protein CopC n=1 Tax=Paraburkholderia sp. D15 TaxID=2880218 RepID=UPI00247B0297|nr:copper homeostasis periplasmic binding protein CopC [Paraburkholderia sp. D15]WGS49312.1 copper homeostasis periplasmic binding protein CopC [Paraburkholderia sp. D15]